MPDPTPDTPVLVEREPAEPVVAMLIERGSTVHVACIGLSVDDAGVWAKLRDEPGSIRFYPFTSLRYIRVFEESSS